MARRVNCLVLDEPSNHLDLEALEALEGALKEFSGTLVMVTHDRYFLDRVAPTVTHHLRQDGAIQQLLDYREYEEQILRTS